MLEIWEHIAEDNDAAADKFIEPLINNFHLLGGFPGAGRQRDELRVGYRSFPVGDYLILYRIIELGVSIMRVMHRRRNLEALLSH